MKMYEIAVLSGDGIGPEVIASAMKVLGAIQEKFKLKFHFVFGEAGFGALEKHGTNLPTETLKILKETDACLKGPMTTPEGPESEQSVAVKIRKKFDLYANVRPCKSYPNTPALKNNIDLVIVRENTEGMYYAKERMVRRGIAVAQRRITRKNSKRIAEFAFNLATKRKKHVTYVHKANILKITDGLFKSSVESVAKKFPQVAVDDMHVDTMAAALVKKPETFDVIVTTNMFGDILSDEAAQVTGGLGLVPSANIGKKYGMFEPIHGSAPKYAGENVVNPIATILATKMMLEFLGKNKAANAIEDAVFKILHEGKVKTYDLGGKASTTDMAEAIVGKIL